MTTLKTLKIGEVARQLGIPQATLRTWVARGLVPCSYRTPGGRYLFSEDDLAAIRNILMNTKDGDNHNE